MLNNKYPSMESWGTPKRISPYELYAVYIFVLCLLLEK